MDSNMYLDKKDVANWYMADCFLCIHLKNGIYIEIPPKNNQIEDITNMLTDNVFSDGKT